MNAIGQRERKTQQRIVKLFREKLRYDYLGDWSDRVGNRNIEEAFLEKFLREKQGYDDALITRALFDLTKAAGNTSHNLYDRNKDVYSLLRYGVPVKSDVGEHKETVWLIDWKHPERIAVKDYTSGAFDGFSKEDVEGLLEDRLTKASEDLEAALEAVRALCEPVDAPKDQQAYFRYPADERRFAGARDLVSLLKACEEWQRIS